MEAHPDYQSMIEQAKEAGFEVKFTTGDPCVKVVEVYDVENKLIRVEMGLYLQKGMRYIDLEHELGHIEQLSRFGHPAPPTDKVIELPNARRKSMSDRKGILTTWQDKILEYHNRLIEFLRLYSRRVDLSLLKEHAKGVDHWQKEYWTKGIKGERSPRRNNWLNQYFADIRDFEQMYKDAMQVINLGRYPEE